jgi:phosphatidylglycerophosphatase A
VPTDDPAPRTIDAPGSPVSLRFLVSHAAHFVALGFGAGLSPVAPGTVGTLVAIPIAALLWHIGHDAAFVAVLLALTAAGVWAAGRTTRDLGRDDDGAIVIDEIAAFLALLFLVGDGVVRIAYAFVLFRLFDIVKPPPIGWLDAHVKGGPGVMLDDFVAAALAAFVYAVTVRLTGWPA